MNTALLVALGPELLLIAAAVTIYLLGAFCAAKDAWPRAALAAIAAAAVLLTLLAVGFVAPAGSLPSGAVRLDALAFFGRYLALAAGGVLALMTWRGPNIAGAAEYAGTLLLATAGAMLSAAASDLVFLFVALELVSIPTYILLYIGRIRAESQEAAVKYFFLSIFTSAIFLYGLSFLYGCAGSTDLEAIRAAVHNGTLPQGFGPFAAIAAVLVLAGLGVKLAAAPFHFYAPDVYQGTTHVNAAILSVLPKMAGLIVLVRLLDAASPTPSESIWRIVVCVAAVTVTWGNIVALWQDNLRRLLAYSSIANSGYILIGLAVGLAAPAEAAWNGTAAALFYLAVYAAATLGVFAVFVALSRGESEETPAAAIGDLAGLGRTRPLPAALLAILLFSLTGIPPLAGFWGKLLVFGSSLNAGGGWFLTLAVIGAVNAAIAAAYYLRIVAALYFQNPSAAVDRPLPPSRAALLAALVCAAAVLAAGVWPRVLAVPCGQSAKYEVRSTEYGERSQEPGVRSSTSDFPGSSSSNP